MAAASALMLTACTSENDVLQSSAAQQQSAPQAVGFDVYMPQVTNVTRAGYGGVMTTDKLKTNTENDKVGFGVFAYHTQGSGYVAAAPNFMYNEHVLWNNGWSYSPLKYWPNETTNDSQDPAASTGAPNNDYLSFFAYAPYVNPTATGTMKVDIGESTEKAASVFSTPETEGIISLSKNTLSNDPLVEWGYTDDLDNNVDLLWGVAPAGFSYTNVSGDNTKVLVGMPLLNLVKPDKDQKVKFLFQHALSRIGFSVVSAIDQIAAGDDGNKFTKDPTTKVLIKNVQVWGEFGKHGVLNLNNTVSNEANWIVESIAKSDDEDVSPLFWFDNGVAISAEAPFSGTANNYIAPDLRYVQSQINAVTGTVEPAVAGDPSKFANINTGVLPSEQTLLVAGPDPSTKVGTAASTPAFEWGKTYYMADGKDYVLAEVSYTAAADLFTFDATADKYTQVYSNGEAIKLNGKSEKLYKLTTGSAVGTETILDNTKTYYEKSTVGGKTVYTAITGTGLAAGTADKYYLKTDDFGALITGIDAYDEVQYWTGLLPRYFMVIPTGDTKIKVKITYAVVTKDEKLNGNVSNVENDITKTVTVDLKNGKSYNLKLILGLTSVKLDATVADWQVADDAEIYLPKNNE